MTHDELLAELNKDIDQTPLVKDYYPIKALFALRAVVELHKPFQFGDDVSGHKPVCSHCQFGVVGDAYPCETIQTIERELA